MKRFLISLIFLLVSSIAFADTLRVVKGGGISDTFIVSYKNMKKSKAILTTDMKDNEYMLYNYGLYYKVNGKVYLTTMYEVEFD